jgi:cytochrome P450
MAAFPRIAAVYRRRIDYCLGGSLARLEGQIAFETLLRRLPELQLAVPAERLRWRRGTLLRGVERLPLRVPTTARTAA